MIETIERMLTHLERGKLIRRQFAVSLASVAVAMFATPCAIDAQEKPTGFSHRQSEPCHRTRS
jgi:hypothetical protein